MIELDDLDPTDMRAVERRAVLQVVPSADARPIANHLVTLADARAPAPVVVGIGHHGKDLLGRALDLGRVLELRHAALGGDIPADEAHAPARAKPHRAR